MSTNIRESLLYKSATEAIVTHKTREGCFNKMIEAAYELTHDEFLSSCRSVEQLMYKEYGITKLPNAWTSAKSVIKTIYLTTTGFKNSDGTFKGKTQLQKEIKGWKASTGTKTPLEEFMLIEDKLRFQWHGLNDTEKNEALNHVVRWWGTKEMS